MLHLWRQIGRLPRTTANVAGEGRRLRGKSGRCADPEPTAAAAPWRSLRNIAIGDCFRRCAVGAACSVGCRLFAEVTAIQASLSGTLIVPHSRNQTGSSPREPCALLTRLQSPENAHDTAAEVPRVATRMPAAPQPPTHNRISALPPSATIWSRSTAGRLLRDGL